MTNNIPSNFKLIFIPIMEKIKKIQDNSIDLIKIEVYCENFINIAYRDLQNPFNDLQNCGIEEIYNYIESIFNEQIFDRIQDEKTQELARQPLYFTIEIERNNNLNDEKRDNLKKFIIARGVIRKSESGADIIDIFTALLKSTTDNLQRVKKYDIT